MLKIIVLEKVSVILPFVPFVVEGGVIGRANDERYDGFFVDVGLEHIVLQQEIVVVHGVRTAFKFGNRNHLTLVVNKETTDCQLLETEIAGVEVRNVLLDGLQRQVGSSDQQDDVMLLGRIEDKGTRLLRFGLNIPNAFRI